MTPNKNCPNETRVALVEAGYARMQTDITEIKTDLKEFINAARATYATKSEVEELRKQTASNTKKLWSLSKEVVYISTTLALITKLVGLW